MLLHLRPIRGFLAWTLCMLEVDQRERGATSCSRLPFYRLIIPLCAYCSLPVHFIWLFIAFKGDFFAASVDFYIDSRAQVAGMEKYNRVQNFRAETISSNVSSKVRNRQVLQKKKTV